MNAGVLLRELWQSWRASLRRPGFVLLAGLTLALGIGFATPLVEVLMRLHTPLDAPQAQQLMLLSRAPPGSWSPMYYRDYQVLRRLPGIASSGLFSTASSSVNAGSGGKLQLVQSLRADRDYLITLGTRMVQGRYFSAAEDQPHGPPAVIVSYRFWQQRLGGGQVVGHDLQVNGHAVPIVGVLPRHFPQINRAAVVLPLRLDAADDATGSLLPVVRLRRGTVPAQLAALATVRFNTLKPQTGASRTQQPPFYCWPFAQAVNGTLPGLSLLLLLSAGTLVLVVVGNLTNLMLTRAQQTRQNLALRAALGAPVTRLLVGAWGEGVLIVLLGATAGVMVGRVVAHLLQTQITLLMRLQSPELAGWATTWWIVAPLALLVTIIGALLATLRVRHLGKALGTLHGAGAGADPGATRSGHALVIAQTVLATALVGIGVLFASAAYRAAHVPGGYNTRDVYQFHIMPTKMQYPDTRSRLQLLRQVLDALHAIPGVETAAASDMAWFGSVFEGVARLPSGKPFYPRMRFFSGDYAKALRIPVLQGQVPNVPTGQAQPLAWANQAFVNRYLHGKSIGQTIELGSGKNKTGISVAGVVGDTYTNQRQHEPMLWIPIDAATSKASGALTGSSLYFIVRMRPGIALPVSTVAGKVHAVAPMLAVADWRPLSSDAPYRLLLLQALAQVAIALAFTTMVLAGIGLYAVTSSATGSRVREFGMRMALGASPFGLMLLVLRGAMLRTLVGLMLGSALAILLGLLARALLLSLGSSWLQPWSLAITWLVLLAMGVLAALLPALRAARTQPNVVLNEAAQ
ncbi:ABC transporter permease [Metallibacterium sp.]